MTTIAGVRSISTYRALSFRLAAYVLTFVSGAAGMFAIQRATVKTDKSEVAQQSNPSQVDTQPALPAVPQLLSELDGTDETPLEPEVLKEPAQEPGPQIAVVSQSVDTLEVLGVTEPAPGHFAKLPLATNQPIAFVDVRVGDKVKKGYQVFSHWESPERLQAAKTEIEKLKKVLEVAKSREAAAAQTVNRLKKVKGSVAAQEMQDAETMSSIRQGEVQAAQLAVTESENRYAAMEFEFNQAFVTTPIDGTVAFVDVTAGERRQLGGPFRGVTVLDTRLLNCRCLLDQSQLSMLDRLAGKHSLSRDLSRTSTVTPATSIEVGADEKHGGGDSGRPIHVAVESEGIEWKAKVISIGQLADSKTGLIPVILEIENPEESLRCGIRVNVSFRGS